MFAGSVDIVFTLSNMVFIVGSILFTTARTHRQAGQRFVGQMRLKNRDIHRELFVLAQLKQLLCRDSDFDSDFQVFTVLLFLSTLKKII